MRSRYTHSPWSGKVDLLVVPMDDYQVVLGIDFLSQVNVAPIPFAGSLLKVRKLPHKAKEEVPPSSKSTSGLETDYQKHAGKEENDSDKKRSA
ncbi:hypothetical protein AMTR_s00003p00267590 [Amborella trichopoda]|uniref:Aspartic peptidase DDI1-type domain-containing protein n=1 Tax=Amborella trichopoda TaxID=13333 RepID=W1P791_AMBTC|nr:hypothetical protein AMTR_s00003p00267590 [Amborella trichopoda]